MWNYAPPYGEGASYTPPPSAPGAPKHIVLQITGVPAASAVEVERLDADHGNVVKAFDAMGRPATPSRDQIAKLRAAAQPAPVERMQLSGGSLSLDIPPQGLVLLKLHSR